MSVGRILFLLPESRDLERKVVSGPVSSRLLNGRERGGSLGSGNWLCTCLLRLERRGGWNGLSYGAAQNVEGTYFIEPASLPFMSIYVELNGQLLPGLNIELFDTVFTKEAEYHFSWVGSRNFKNILLTHPGIARASRYTAVCR